MGFLYIFYNPVYITLSVMTDPVINFLVHNLYALDQTSVIPPSILVSWLF